MTEHENTCKNCRKPIEPERTKWASLCVKCGDPCLRKQQLRKNAREEDPEYTDYNPEKARVWRESFQRRDRLGRTWNEYHRDWLDGHPGRRKLNNAYAAKSKLIRKLGLKGLLIRSGLSPASTRRLLRLVSMNELPGFGAAIKEWDRTRSIPQKTFQELLEHAVKPSEIAFEASPPVSKGTVGQVNKLSSGPNEVTASIMVPPTQQRLALSQKEGKIA